MFFTRLSSRTVLVNGYFEESGSNLGWGRGRPAPSSEVAGGKQVQGTVGRVQRAAASIRSSVVTAFGDVGHRLRVSKGGE